MTAVGTSAPGLGDRPDPADLSGIAAVPPERLPAALEAVLIASDVPVPAAVLADLLQVELDVVLAALHSLAAAYDDRGHGFGLHPVAGGWRLESRAEFAALLARHLAESQQVRLTKAAVEALTVVAYQQPVTRALVSAVRGVASDGVLRTLTTHGLVEECGTDEGGALRYRTTSAFLERLGVDSLGDLPPLAPHLPDLPGPDDPPDGSDAAAAGSAVPDDDLLETL